VRAQASVAEVLPGHKREVRGRKAESEVWSNRAAAERPADADGEMRPRRQRCPAVVTGRLAPANP
jgi:hypothetical protein